MQPFNSAWKAILGISILCFLNLCMAGLQWTLSICWDVGSSSSSFANRAGSQAESMAKEAGGRGGSGRAAPAAGPRITQRLCLPSVRTLAAPSGLLVFIIAESGEPTEVTGCVTGGARPSGAIKTWLAACLGDPVELRDLRGSSVADGGRAASSR